MIKTNNNYAVLTLENTTVTGHTVNAADICAVDASTNRTATAPLVNVSGTTSITGNTSNGVPANISVTGTGRLTISADLSGEIGITTPQNAVGNQFAVKVAAVTEIGTLTCDTNSAFLPKLDENKIIWESLANIRQMFGNPDTTIDDLKTYPDEDDLARIPQGAVAGGANETNPHMLWKSVKHNNNNSIDITLNFFKKQQDIKLDFIFVIDETGTMTHNASGNGFTTSQAKWARYAAAVASEGIFDLNDRYQTNGADSRICYISYSGHGTSTQIYKSGWLTDTNSALLWANSTKVGGGDTYHDIVVEDILSAATESKEAGHTPVLVWMCDYTARYGEGHSGCVDSNNMARIKASIPDRYAMLIYETYNDTMKARMGYLTDYQFYMPNKSDPSTLVTPILQIVRDAVARCGDKLAIEDGLNSGVAAGADANGITSTGEGSVAASYDSGTDTAKWTLINSGEDDNRLHAGRMYTKVIHIPMTDDVYSGQMPTNTDVELKDGSTVLNSIPASQSPLIKSDVTLLLKGTNTSGSALSGATFTLTRGSNTWNLTTDADGKFVLPWGENDTVGDTTAESTVAFDKGSTYTLTQNTTVSGFVRPAGSWTLTVGNDYKITATTNASPANTNRTRDMVAKAGKFEIYNDAAPKIIYHYNQPVGTKTDVEEPVSFAVDATSKAHTLGGVYNTQVEGYTFTGWATAANASEASYHEGEEITVYAKGSGTEPDPVELYGVWVQEGELVPLTIEKKWDENIDWTKEPYASQKAANPTVNFVVYGCTAADSTTGTQITAYTDDTGTAQVTSISESDSAGMISNWARTVYVPKSVTEGGAKKTFTSYRIEEINLQVAGGKGAWDTPAEDYQSSSDSFVTVTTDKLPEGVKIYAPRNVDSVNLDLDLSTNYVVNNITSVTIEYGVNNNQYIFRTKAEFENTKTLGPGSSINPKYEHIYQLKLLTNAAGHKPVFRKLYINDVEYSVGPGNWISRAVITTGGNVTTRPEDLDVSASTTTVSYLVKESQDRRLTVTNSFSLPVDEKVPVIVNKVWDDRITWTDNYFKSWKDLNKEIPLTVDGESQTLKTDDSVVTSELARGGQSTYPDATEHNPASQSFSKLFYVENGFDATKLQEGTLQKADNNYVWTKTIEETNWNKWVNLTDSGYTQKGYIHLHSNTSVSGANNNDYQGVKKVIFQYTDGVNNDIIYQSTANVTNATLNEEGANYYIEVLLPSNVNMSSLTLANPQKYVWSDGSNGSSGELRFAIQVCRTGENNVDNLPKSVQGRARTAAEPDTRYDNVSFCKSVPSGGKKIEATSNTLKAYFPTQYTITNSLSICKIVDTDGVEHGFPTLNAAVVYSRNAATRDKAYAVDDGNGGKQCKIEMLVDYVIPSADKVTLDRNTDNIIITTAATSGGVYNFTPTFTSEQGRLDDDGNRAILKRGDSSDNNASLFTVNHASAVLSTEDIIFDGGAVYTKKTDGSYTVTGITANTHGGIVLGTKGAVTIKGGTTMRNSNVGTESNWGGAVYSPNAADGATITIDNAAGKTIEFLNCTAGNGGAIKSYRKPLTVTNNGTLKFVNCDARHGGALFTEYNGANISITNTGTMLFDDCDATSGVGGAIGTYTSTSNVSITNTSGSISFKDCSASSTGGAISANGAVTISGDGASSFTGCTSSSNGGAIYANGAVTISGDGASSFTGCKASSNGGAIYQEGGNALTLTNVTFGKTGTPDSGCSAAATGGAIYTAAAGTLTDCSFYYCKTTSSTSGGGGAIYYYNGIQQLNGCVFDHCEAAGGSQSQGLGGAIKYEKGGKLVIDRSDARRSAFTNCTANRFGGAIAFELNEGTFEVKNTDFTSCVATNRNGGAIGSDAATLNIVNSTFNDCKAEKGNGGAICAGMDGVTPNVQMENSVVTGCASQSGAAIYSKGNLTIKQSGSGTSEIKNCSASDANGGAVNVYGDSNSGKTMTFEGNVVIYDNKGTGSLADQQKNVVLDQNNNAIINTSATGLGANAHIGVYVTGTKGTTETQDTDPYKSRGGFEDDFGTYPGGGSTDNFDAFSNDRNGLYGEVCPDHANKIRWVSYLCKLTDASGNLLYKDAAHTDAAVYKFLKTQDDDTDGRKTGGFHAAQGDLYTSTGEAFTGTAIQVQMLRNYTQPATDQPTISGGRAVTFTTANQSAEDNPGTGDIYVYNQGNDKTNTEADRATIWIASEATTGSMLTVNASAKLSTTKIILDGANVTTSANGGIINSAGSATVNADTILRNSSAANGGAIYTSSGFLNIGAVSILDCYATQDGGAIYLADGVVGGENGMYLDGHSKLKLNSTDDDANRTQAAEAAANAVNGGGIYVSSGARFTFTGGELIKCKASGNGGALYNAGTVTMEEKTGTTALTRGSLEYCSATDGGAIYNAAGGTVDMTGGYIEHCLATRNGGGIYTSSTGSAATGKGAVNLHSDSAHPGVIDDCHATNGGGIYLGRVSTDYENDVTISITGGTIQNCYATANGGAIYDDSKAKIELNGVTINGHADDGLGQGTKNAVQGGAIYLPQLDQDYTSSLTLTGCNLYNLTAAQGGAIFSNRRSLDPQTGAVITDPTTMIGCNINISGGEINGHTGAFASSTQANAGNGGVIYLGNGSVNINGTKIYNCTVSGNGNPGENNTGGSGGVLFNVGNGHPNNDRVSPTVTMTNVTINGHYNGYSADIPNAQNGGAIFMKMAILSMENCTLTNLSVEPGSSGGGKGAAIFGYTNGGGTTPSEITISSGTIFGNKASGTGGGAINVVSGYKVSNGAGNAMSSTVSFEGDAVVYNNGTINSSGNVTQQKNMVLELDQLNSNNGVIQTTAAGLGADAHIGVYVVGDDSTNPYQEHGQSTQPFGTVQGSDTSKQYLGGVREDGTLYGFTNDRSDQNDLDSLLYGTKEGYDDDNLIYWSGSTGSRRVILRKVDSTYKSIEGAVFTIHKGNSNDAYKLKGETTSLSNLDSKASGVFWIGTLPYGVYYLHETTVPSGYTGHGTSEGRWFYLVVGDDTVAGSRDGVYMSEGYANREAAKTGYETWNNKTP